MNATAKAISMQYDPYPFEAFAPTLSQCFVIVIVGYLMARFEILSAKEVKGVNAFAIYFAMPGIICISLADADLGDFRWELLVGILLGKFLIFILIAGVLLILNNNMGVSGLVALFCVQSNDLPVGNPLMSALYKDYRPHMSKYLFFIPAMTVIFFVPIGNIMLQVYRSQRTKETLIKQNSEEGVSENHLAKHVLKGELLKHFAGLVKNPVVLATVIGLILNFTFDRQLPEVLHQPIQVIAATIPGTALAILGFSMARKERFLISSTIVLATVLLFVKMLLTPILLHTIMKILTDESSSSKLLSDFALLYGIISPATAVFQSGIEFRKSLAVMSAALILTSFMCFPVSYVVARNTIATAPSLNSFVPVLKRVLFWTACFNILCNVIVWITIMLKKQWREVPCNYVVLLTLSQATTSFGVILWCVTEGKPWSVYCQTAFYYGGEVSGYLWTCILAMVLIFNDKYRAQIKNMFRVLAFIVFSLSALSVLVICLLTPRNTDQRVYVVGRTKSSFEFHQMITTTILLFICVITLSASLALHFKISNCRKMHTSSSEIKEFRAYDNAVYYIQEDETTKDCNKEENSSAREIHVKLRENKEAELYYKNILGSIDDENKYLSNEKDWIFRFSSLVLILWIILSVRLIANLYKFFESKALEILVPMEFLQSTLFVGQGFFVMLTFGIDVRTFTITLRKWWRKMWNQEERISQVDLRGENAAFCKHFYNYYFMRCFRDLARERRWKDITYSDSFWGHQLVDWLISEGLCTEDSEAEEIGQKLLTGGVIRHVTERHNFHDAPFLYCFPGNNINHHAKQMMS